MIGRLLCFIGVHDWIYADSGLDRRCMRYGCTVRHVAEADSIYGPLHFRAVGKDGLTKRQRRIEQFKERTR